MRRRLGRRLRNRRSRGAALVTALATIVVVGAVGAALTSHTLQSIALLQHDRAATRARLAAEGGVEAARAALRRDPAWAGGAVTVGGLEVHVTAVRTAESGTVAVESRAPGAVVEAAVRLGDGLPSIASWRER